MPDANATPVKKPPGPIAAIRRDARIPIRTAFRGWIRAARPST